jgi:hypothetical protein
MSLFGREEGIRTLETFRFTHFPGVRLQPLGHLSINFLNYATTLYPCFSMSQGARRMLVTPYFLYFALRAIIEKTSIMFKIAPGNFSQPLGHLSINLLAVIL